MMLSLPSQMHLRIFQESTFNLKGDWADGFINNKIVNAKTQMAASRLRASSNLNDSAPSKLTVLCQQEATNNEFSDIDCSIPARSFEAHDSEGTRLCSTGEVAGVNKLPPPHRFRVPGISPRTYPQFLSTAAFLPAIRPKIMHSVSAQLPNRSAP